MNPEDIDKLLPQTQCGDCGYGGCMPYAAAMAKGTADINLCPPGGRIVLNKLARVFNKNPDNYSLIEKPRAVAKIREADCIGCTKCIQACPVDAISGAAKLMHTVITDECTGCRLCIDPCPMDCIDLIELPDKLNEFELEEQAEANRQRFNFRETRLARRAEENSKQHQRAKCSSTTDQNSALAKKLAIQAAIARAQAKRSGHD